MPGFVKEKSERNRSGEAKKTISGDGFLRCIKRQDDQELGAFLKISGKGRVGKVKSDNLLKRLGALGLPFLDVEEEGDANLTLADVVKSGDLRLWEGFPVVLANSAERGLFDYAKVESCLKGHSDKLLLDLLVALSLALYKALNLKFSWENKLYKLLDKGGRRQYENYLEGLKNNRDLHVQNHLMSSQRIKETFNNYFRQTQESLNDLLLAKEELGLEYALSQVFSPKQKELFLRKLRNEKMTKTEKEYFSRVVKKRVLALADPQLHRLSQKLLQNL